MSGPTGVLYITTNKWTQQKLTDFHIFVHVPTSQLSLMSQYLFVSLSISRYQILLQYIINCIHCFGEYMWYFWQEGQCLKINKVVMSIWLDFFYQVCQILRNTRRSEGLSSKGPLKGTLFVHPSLWKITTWRSGCLGDILLTNSAGVQTDNWQQGNSSLPEIVETCNHTFLQSLVCCQYLRVITFRSWFDLSPVGCWAGWFPTRIVSKSILSGWHRRIQ